jgi:translation elongation factor EF-G
MDTLMRGIVDSLKKVDAAITAAQQRIEILKLAGEDTSQQEATLQTLRVRQAKWKAMAQAKPTLLEPIMTVEVIAPGECMGDIVGDLNSKRGRVLGIEGKGRNQAVKANVPLAEMLEYDSRLRSITGDRGDYSMEFSHYEEAPAHVQEKIVAEAKRPEEEEEE